MAEPTVSGVRFRDSVLFNQTENKVLRCERDKCSLTRVAGGVKAVGKNGTILVPDSNITSIEFSDEPKRG